MCAGFVGHHDAVALGFRVGCVCVRAFVCMCVYLFSCVLVSRVRNADVATDVPSVLGSCVHSRSLLKKKWSDARAAWNFQIHEQGESTRLKIYFYVTAI